MRRWRVPAGTASVVVKSAFGETFNPIVLGCSNTPDFIRGGDKFVLHPRNTESSKKKC